MSETERHIGKVRKADLKGMNTEDWCKKKCEELGIANEIKWHDTYEETLLSESNETPVVKVNGEFWEVIEDKEEEDYEDISIIRPNNDGTYDFLFQFYNGGTCLSEMLEDGIKKIYKQNKNK